MQLHTHARDLRLTQAQTLCACVTHVVQREREGACVMALIRSLLQRFMQNKRKAQEEYDVWKLYNLLHYHQESGGREVQVSRPPDVAYHEQCRLVHSSVTRQVILILATVYLLTSTL